MNGVAIALYLLVSAWFCLIYLRGKSLLNPALLFVITQTIMFTGTLRYLDAGVQSDVNYFWLAVYAIFLFIAGYLVADYFFPIRNAREYYRRPVRPANSATQDLILDFLFGLSLLIVVLYFATGAGNVFLGGLRALSSGGEFNAVEARRSYAVGSAFLSAGYALQFRVVLLPALTAFFVVRYLLQRRKLDLLIAIVGVPVSIFGALGTGQRGGFVDAALISSLFAAAVLPNGLRRRYLTVVIASGGLLFVLATLALGRSSSGGSVAERIPAAAQEALERFTAGNQIAALYASRYVAAHPDEGRGESARGLIGLLPGFDPGITLPQKVSQMLYNTTQGTVPGTQWTHWQYDFGRRAVFFIAILLGFLYQRLFAWLISRPKTLGNALQAAGLCVLFGTWAAGGLEAPIIRGVLALLVLGFLLRLRWYQRPKELPRSVAPLPNPSTG